MTNNMTKHHITNEKGQHLTDAYGNKVTAYFTVTEDNPTRAQKALDKIKMLKIRVNHLINTCNPRWAVIFKQR